MTGAKLAENGYKIHPDTGVAIDLIVTMSKLECDILFVATLKAIKPDCPITVEAGQKDPMPDTMWFAKTLINMNFHMVAFMEYCYNGANSGAQELVFNFTSEMTPEEKAMPIWHENYSATAMIDDVYAFLNEKFKGWKLEFKFDASIPEENPNRAE
jgi:hypothetical protein